MKIFQLLMNIFLDTCSQQLLITVCFSELSEVLWNMILRNGLRLGHSSFGFLPIFIVFAPWAFLTVFILLLMEGLSAFLHTLRLHWYVWHLTLVVRNIVVFVTLVFWNKERDPVIKSELNHIVSTTFPHYFLRCTC